MNAFIRLLVTMLPPAGDVWAAEEQEVWLDLMRLVLANVYLPKPSPHG